MRAYVDALGEVGLSELTVAEICRGAGIHRVTFYGHWPDIRSLAVDALGDVVDRLAGVPDEVVLSASSPRLLTSAYHGALRSQLAELREHRSVYRELLAPDFAAFRSRIETGLRDRAEDAIAHLATMGVAVGGQDTRYPAITVAAAVTACFVDWTFSDDTDVEFASAAIMQQLPAWWPQ